MHNIQPKTRYQFLIVTLAVPADLNVSVATDALNDTFNGILAAPEPDSDWLVDWRLDCPQTIVTSSATPCEGELFNRKSKIKNRK